MAEFMMRQSHTKNYRRQNLAHLAETHEVDYVEQVKKLMLEIHKRKGKK